MMLKGVLATLALHGLLASAFPVVHEATTHKTSHGAVASEVSDCSEIGIEILKDGGNAVDSIIATTLCVGTIASYHSGIGGGGFGIVRFKDGDGFKYEMFDFRETAPGAANETMYLSNTSTTLSTIGGLAVGTPGEIRGWELLHKRHGKLPWKKLFQPAIKLARNGFNVTVDLSNALAEAEWILDDPIWAETYAPNGTLLVEGDIAYRKRYANVLEGIANNGPDYFYTGEVAVNTVEAIHDTGGVTTLADLANYTALLREPVNITYRDQYRAFSTVAPSSGSVVLSALKIFEGYVGNYSDSNPEINVTTHRLLEATRFAYGQRTEFGDPAFTPNVTEIEAASLTDAMVEYIRSQIWDNQTFPLTYYDPEKYISLNDSGTSHVAAADKDGNAVSLTTTVNLYFGSHVMTADGIVLNNEMDDFSSPGQTNSFGFAASPINYIRPYKRPQSSISSSIVESLDGQELRVVTGSAGGSRIITATLQQIYHSLDQGLSAHDAAHHPRWHDQLDGKTYFEQNNDTVGIAGFNNGTIAYLAGLGYNTTFQGTTGSTSHLIQHSKNGTFSAASDPRKAAGAGLAY